MRILIFCLLFCLVSEIKSQTDIGSTRTSQNGIQGIYDPFTIDPQLYGIWKQAESSIWVSDIFLFDTNRIVIYEYDFDMRSHRATEYPKFLKKGDCYFVSDNGSYRYIGTLSAGRLVLATGFNEWEEYEKTDTSKLNEQEKAILKPGSYYGIKTREENDYKIYGFYNCQSLDAEISLEEDTTHQDYSPIIVKDDRVLWGRRKPNADDDLYGPSLNLEIVTKKIPFEWPVEEVTCPTEKDKDGAIIFGPCKDNKPQLKLTNESTDTIRIPFEYFSQTCQAKLTLIKNNGDTVSYSYGIMKEYASKKIQFIELLPRKSLMLDNQSYRSEEILYDERKNRWSKPKLTDEKIPTTGILKAEFSIVPHMDYGPKNKYWNGKVDAIAVEVKF